MITVKKFSGKRMVSGIEHEVTITAWSCDQCGKIVRKVRDTKYTDYYLRPGNLRPIRDIKEKSAMIINDSFFGVNGVVIRGSNGRNVSVADKCICSVECLETCLLNAKLADDMRMEKGLPAESDFEHHFSAILNDLNKKNVIGLLIGAGVGLILSKLISKK